MTGYTADLQHAKKRTMLPAQPKRIAQDDSLDCLLVAPSVFALNLADSKLLADALLRVRGTTALFASNGLICQFVQTFRQLKRMGQNYCAAVTENAHSSTVWGGGTRPPICGAIGWAGIGPLRSDHPMQSACTTIYRVCTPGEVNDRSGQAFLGIGSTLGVLLCICCMAIAS